MRLTCPNCEAQYEVSDSVIPLHGRDVQCSNCGQTWFQSHPTAAPDPVEDDDDQPPGDDALPDVAAGSWVDPDPADARSGPDLGGPDLGGPDQPGPEQTEPDQPAPDLTTAPPEPDYGEIPGHDHGEIPGHDAPMADAAPVAAADMGEPPMAAAEPVAPPDRFADDDFAEPAQADGAADAAIPPPAEPKRRSLDEAVLTVLREEADREARARKAAGGVETQTDLNLGQQESVPRPAPALDALPKLRVQSLADTRPGDMLSGGPRRPIEDLSTPFEPEDLSGDPAETVSAARPSRRNLLPDIEEINSSLQAEEAKGRGAPPTRDPSPRQARRGGFRTGFLLVVLLAAAVMALYIAAPALGSRFPAAAPTLNAIVATIDRGRVAIDALMQKSLDSLNSGDKPAP